MALIRFGPIVSDARNSQGGTVFSRNRFGAYTRNRVTPVNPNTPEQSAARSRLTLCQGTYRADLTDAQRVGWKNLSANTTFPNALGDQVRLTSINLFIRTNTLRLAAGEAIIEDAPAAPAGTDVPVATAAADATAGVQITALDPDLAADEILACFAAGPFADTRNRFFGPWKFPVYQVGALGVGTIDIVPGANVDTGEIWFVQYRRVDALGRVSNYALQRLVAT